MRGIALAMLLLALVSCGFSRVSDRFLQNVETVSNNGQTEVSSQWMIRGSSEPMLKISIQSSMFSEQDLKSIAETVGKTINYKLGIYHYQQSEATDKGMMVREEECIECTIHRF